MYLPSSNCVSLVYTSSIMVADLVACAHLLAPNVCNTKVLPFIVKDTSTVEHFQTRLFLLLGEGRLKSLTFQEAKGFLNKQPGAVDIQAKEMSKIQ